MTDAPSGKERPVNMWEELNRPKPRVEEAPVPREVEDDRPKAPVAGIIGGLIAVGAVLLAGFIVMGGGDTSTSEEDAVADASLAMVDDEGAAQAVGDVGTGDGADGAAADVSDGAADGDAAATDTGAGDTADDPTVDAYSPAIPAGADGSYSVLSRGKIYLRGDIPSPLIEAGIINALEQILGPGNVVSEYVIDPEAEFVMGRPTEVYIEDTVLFAFASAEIAPDFYPLLGLGVTLLNLQEGVTMEVYGHTDSAGSDETNLRLSQARVDAVKAFYIAQGMDPNRITAIGRGESEPVADNSTARGRQLNRRVEFVINGFTFSM
jgi:outer membrane protein OmpA-like peptidoglycan-associated protein